jgi:hypothetical protein
MAKCVLKPRQVVVIMALVPIFPEVETKTLKFHLTKAMTLVQAHDLCPRSELLASFNLAIILAM